MNIEESRKDPRRDCLYSWGIGRELTDEQYHEQLARRFWAKVDKTPGQGPNGDCWEYTGSRDTRGYANIGYCHGNIKRPVKGSRVAFLLTHGRWPFPQACHSCDNPPCCRPDHIWEGTAKDNMRDAQAKGRMPVAAPEVERAERVRLTPAQRRMLKTARKRKGVNIYTVAAVLGMNYTTYYFIEVGRRTVRTADVYTLLSYYGIDEQFFKLKPEQLYKSGFEREPKPQPQTFLRTARAEGYDAHALNVALRPLIERGGIKRASNEIGVSWGTLRTILQGKRVKESTLLKVLNHVGLTLNDVYAKAKAA